MIAAAYDTFTLTAFQAQEVVAPLLGSRLARWDGGLELSPEQAETLLRRLRALDQIGDAARVLREDLELWLERYLEVIR